MKGRKGRVFRRKKILDSLTKWYERKSTTELITCVKHRISWRNMTDNIDTASPEGVYGV